MLRFYEKHNLASKLFLFNKETQVDFFLILCSGNQSVIAGVRIFYTIAASLRAVFHWFLVFAFLTLLLLPCEQCFIDLHNHELTGGTTLIQRTIIPWWRDAITFGSIVCHTKSKKMIEMATDSSMTNLSLTRKSHRAQWLQRVCWCWAKRSTSTFSKSCSDTLMSSTSTQGKRGGAFSYPNMLVIFWDHSTLEYVEPVLSNRYRVPPWSRD